MPVKPLTRSPRSLGYGFVIAAVLLLPLPNHSRESLLSAAPAPAAAPVPEPPAAVRDRAGASLDRQVRQAWADATWCQEVAADLERREYAVTATTGGFQARNRAHNLRARFGALPSPEPMGGDSRPPPVRH